MPGIGGDGLVNKMLGVVAAQTYEQFEKMATKVEGKAASHPNPNPDTDTDTDTDDTATISSSRSTRSARLKKRLHVTSFLSKNKKPKEDNFKLISFRSDCAIRLHPGNGPIPKIIITPPSLTTHDFTESSSTKRLHVMQGVEQDNVDLENGMQVDMEDVGLSMVRVGGHYEGRDVETGCNWSSGVFPSKESIWMMSMAQDVLEEIDLEKEKKEAFGKKPQPLD